MSPTQRSLAHARSLGFTVAVSEHWNHFGKRRVDLFGAFDLLAVRPDAAGVLGVQATTGDNAAARVRKLVENPAVRVWLLAGNTAEVWGWSKRGPRGGRKTWGVVCRKVSLGDLPAAEATPGA
jgi:hypothetical protein